MNGGKCRKETTKGWEILLQGKDGPTTWESLKDVKECYPVQLSEYAHQKKISNEPAFAWWVPQVLKKRKLDKENGDTLWWDSICLEMKNIRVAFEEYDDDPSELPPGYQEIKCHMIFDIKMGENCRRKARMVAGGRATTTQGSLTYSSVTAFESH